MADYVGETTSSSVGLTLGGILSIKQTPPYRIHARTLLDLIRDDPSHGKESKNTWKMFRDKLRFKLYGPVSATAAPATSPHAHVSTIHPAHVSTNPHAHVRTTSPAHVSTSHQAHVSVDPRAHVSTEEDRIVEVDRRGGGGGEGGGAAAVRMSLMSLLEVEACAYMNDDGEEEVVVEEGGGDGYNNCCVCMVRHKGAAFIPCGHTFCRLCSRELFVKRASCPLCNNLILEILDIF